MSGKPSPRGVGTEPARAVWPAVVKAVRAIPKNLQLCQRIMDYPLSTYWFSLGHWCAAELVVAELRLRVLKCGRPPGCWSESWWPGPTVTTTCCWPRRSAASSCPDPNRPGGNPQGRCLDKGYDYPSTRTMAPQLRRTLHLRTRGEEARACRPGHKARRGVVARAHYWLNRCRRRFVRWKKGRQLRRHAPPRLRHHRRRPSGGYSDRLLAKCHSSMTFGEIIAVRPPAPGTGRPGQRVSGRQWISSSRSGSGLEFRREIPG